MGYARGLVKYSTQNALSHHWTGAQTLRHVLRPRVMVYAGILGAVVLAMALSLALRTPFKVDVVRDRGALARVVGDGFVENSYRLQVMNATESAQHYQVRVDGLPGVALAASDKVEVGSAQSRWMPLALRIDPQAAVAAGAGVHPVRFTITAVGSGQALVEKSTFVVPR